MREILYLVFLFLVALMMRSARAATPGPIARSASLAGPSVRGV